MHEEGACTYLYILYLSPWAPPSRPANRIDYNMEAAVDHAKEGVQELVKAEEHQKSATPIKVREQYVS